MWSEGGLEVSQVTDKVFSFRLDFVKEGWVGLGCMVPDVEIVFLVRMNIAFQKGEWLGGWKIEIRMEKKN